MIFERDNRSEEPHVKMGTFNNILTEWDRYLSSDRLSDLTAVQPSIKVIDGEPFKNLYDKTQVIGTFMERIHSDDADKKVFSDISQKYKSLWETANRTDSYYYMLRNRFLSFIDPSDTIFWNNESALYSLRAEINTLLDSKELNYLPGYDFYLDTPLSITECKKKVLNAFWQVSMIRLIASQ